MSFIEDFFKVNNTIITNQNKEIINTTTSKENTVSDEVLSAIYFRLKLSEILPTISKEDFIFLYRNNKYSLALDNYKNTMFNHLLLNTGICDLSNLGLLSVLVNPDTEEVKNLQLFVKDLINKNSDNTDLILDALNKNIQELSVLLLSVLHNKLPKEMLSLPIDNFYELDVKALLTRNENFYHKLETTKDFSFLINMLSSAFFARDITVDCSDTNHSLKIDMIIDNISYCIYLFSIEENRWTLTIQSSGKSEFNLDLFLRIIKVWSANKEEIENLINHYTVFKRKFSVDTIYSDCSQEVKDSLKLIGVSNSQDLYSSFLNFDRDKLIELFGSIIAKTGQSISDNLKNYIIPILYSNDSVYYISDVKKRFMLFLVTIDEIDYLKYESFLASELKSIKSFLMDSRKFITTKGYLIQQNLSEEQFCKLSKQYEDLTFEETIDNYLKTLPHILKFKKCDSSFDTNKDIKIDYNVILKSTFNDSNYSTSISFRFTNKENLFIYFETEFISEMSVISDVHDYLRSNKIPIDITDILEEKQRILEKTRRDVIKNNKQFLDMAQEVMANETHYFN